MGTIALRMLWVAAAVLTVLLAAAPTAYAAGEPARVVASLKPATTVPQITATIKQLTGDKTTPTFTVVSRPDSAHPHSLLVLQTASANAAKQLRDALSQTKLFRRIGADARAYSQVTYTATPNDPYFAYDDDGGSWGLRTSPGIDAVDVWTRLATLPGNAQTAPVAVIDTGFDMSVADHGGNIVAGYDFGDGDSNVNPDPGDTDADVFHGTSTAGLIGAATNNAIGIAGAAWDNRVVVYKAANNQDQLYLSAVTDCIVDITQKQNARIINMSLGGPDFPDYLKDAIDDAIAAGILVIASAGNYGNTAANPVIYPAAYAPVVSVGAIDIDGAPSYFSTHNSAVDVAAPGSNIAVLGLSSNYLLAAGTSYSAPYTAATAALIWRAAPNLTAAQVTALITQTAVDVTQSPAAAGTDIWTGVGAINAAAAVDAALGLPDPPTITRTAAGKNRVTLYWIAPRDANGPLRTYAIQYRKTGTATWTTYAHAANTATTITVTGLAEGATYEFRIAAENARGTGGYSPAKTGAPYGHPTLASSRSTVYIRRGKTLHLRVADYYATNETLTITWSSSKRSVATVTSGTKAAAKRGHGSLRDTTIATTTRPGGSSGTLKGLSIAIKGLKVGSATLSLKPGAGKTVKVKIRVVGKTKKLGSVSLTALPAGHVMAIGATKRVSAKLSPASATDVAVTWSSSNPAVLAVDATGRLVALKAGKAKLTARAGSHKKSVTITVK
jgi:subtilisin family serine protease